MPFPIKALKQRG